MNVRLSAPRLAIGLISAMVLLLIISVVWVLVTRQATPPHLVVGQQHVVDDVLTEHVDVERDPTYIAEYVLHNSGGKPLKITNIQVSCGCMAYYLESYEITRGSSATLSVRIRRSWNLERNEAISFNTNDQLIPAVRLTAQVGARNPVPCFAPTNARLVEFGRDAQPGQERRINIVSYEKPGEEWVKLSQCELVGIELIAEDTTEAETREAGVVLRTRSFLFRIPVDCQPGTLGGVVVFSPEQPRNDGDFHSLSVRGEICAVRAIPTVFLINRSTSKGADKPLTLIGPTDWNLEASFINGPEGVIITRTVKSEANAEMFNVHFAESELPSRVSNLTFETNHPLARNLNVKILAP